MFLQTYNNGKLTLRIERKYWIFTDASIRRYDGVNYNIKISKYIVKIAGDLSPALVVNPKITPEW